MQPTDPSKFTEQAWDAIVKSQDVARRYQNQQLEVEHLIIALLEQQGTANKILNRVAIEPENLLQQIDSFAKRQPKVGSIEHLYLGRSLEIFLDLADEAREKWEDKFIAVEHLLLAFYQDKRLGNKLLSGG
ncbi:MAG: ATP-dependent chaperone ClpB, partial [Okeania sp. SIO2D1]|nr:ATP-dependent chaperone ClpB [Okeania sp. SIO2D1]